MIAFCRWTKVRRIDEQVAHNEPENGKCTSRNTSLHAQRQQVFARRWEKMKLGAEGFAGVAEANLERADEEKRRTTKLRRKDKALTALENLRQSINNTSGARVRGDSLRFNGSKCCCNCN